MAAADMYNVRREGKTFIVTGGASGLGLAVVEALFDSGANVAVFDRNSEAGEQLVKGKNRMMFLNVDVVDEDSVKQGIAQVVQKFGRLDGVVNCAGVASGTKTWSESRGPHPLKAFDFVIKVNLYGTFNMCRFGADAMSKNAADKDGLRGVLINVASVAAFEGQQGQVAYSASKNAVVGMSLPMARDLAKVGIRVNCVAPGIFATPMMQAVPDRVRDNLLTSVVAPKRMGTPAEFAHIVTTFIDNRYLNATVIRVDGGVRFQNL